MRLGPVGGFAVRTRGKVALYDRPRGVRKGAAAIPRACAPTEDAQGESPATAVTSWQERVKGAAKGFAVFSAGMLVGVGLLVGISLVEISSDGALGDSAIDAHQAELRQKMQLFDLILSDIDTAYVDPINPEKLFETGVNAMLGSLDPYTQFENVSENQELQLRTSGRYGGIGLGIGVDVRNGSDILVMSAFEGYAYDAGLRPGDRLISINDTLVNGANLQQTTERLRGAPGSTVRVQVQRPGVPEPLAFQLERKRVMLRDVPTTAYIGSETNRVGYIRLQSFARNAGLEVRSALQALKAGGKFNALVLDLRGNPGGLLDGAVEVAEQFVPKGSTIVTTRGRALGDQAYVTSRDPIFPQGTPLVVLVDGNSASASEIVAGALQDLDIGVVVGSRTYGKGLIQNIQTLPYSTSLRFTVGRYYTPSGRCIQALNYKDGAAGAKKYADGERKEFRTRNGRVVRDAGGIEPDLIVEAPKVSDLEASLFKQGAFLSFADKFAEKHPNGPGPNWAGVDDALYNEFKQFVLQNKTKLESRFDETLAELTRNLSEAGYTNTSEEMETLRNLTHKDMMAYFASERRLISRDLQHHILMRFEPESQWLLDDLKYDNQVAEALRLLSDGDQYAALLRAPDAASNVALNVTQL
ncbi:Carboxy-terminal-processing protease [Porphyridium purpureum]|uniref:Carboxy-terminal-processing protease n=1 Tax=Porphyridium purpureum TaxID=35688 RepID=A0A5J4YVE6_PORPP|nr:Carboxy-terminal-processing protease [Porphyridium purpureum]|eukprot:POR3214..scf227_4